jgi:hypothetical protein
MHGLRITVCFDAHVHTPRRQGEGKSKAVINSLRGANKPLQNQLMGDSAACCDICFSRRVFLRRGRRERNSRSVVILSV